MTGNGGLSLQFPDGPKTALDELIDQLIEGAGRVRRTQGRLRALLRASATVTGDLRTDAVLHNLAHSAAGLTDARHAAVVVFDHDDVATDVVHTGLTDEQLGLVRDRRRDCTPDGVLRCPITLGEVAFGEILLFDSAREAFSDEDSELVRALAETAATAIGHARLYDESQRHQHWLRANAQIIRQILTSDGEDPLAVVARMAATVADADLVTVALLTEAGDEVVVEAGSGLHAEEFIGQRFPVIGSLDATALTEGTPLPIDDYHSAFADARQLSPELDAGPVMLLPLIGGQRTWGVLSLVRLRGRPVFSEEDLAMASDFANHATISLELAEARETEQRVRVMEDRERIARDLHDHVIQELFAIGLGIESLAGAAGLPDPVRNGLRDRVEDLDRTIRRVRTSIFALRGTWDRSHADLRSALLEIVGELTPHLGFAPAVQFSGDPGVLDDGLLSDVTAVVREALTNVARHAQADGAVVELVASGDKLVVNVADDGVGIGEATQRSGTANLRSRAERRGGTCTVGPGSVRGTLLTWEVGLS